MQWQTWWAFNDSYWSFLKIITLWQRGHFSSFIVHIICGSLIPSTYLFNNLDRTGSSSWSTKPVKTFSFMSFTFLLDLDEDEGDAFVLVVLPFLFTVVKFCRISSGSAKYGIKVLQTHLRYASWKTQWHNFN